MSKEGTRPITPNICVSCHQPSRAWASLSFTPGSEELPSSTKSESSLPATAASANRRPGRPARYEYQDLLDAAMELFWKRGYDNTTTRDLERALGVSQSSLYNQFGSKQELLVSALDRYEELTSQAVLTALEQPNLGFPAIKRFFNDLARWVTHEGRRGCMLINMMAEDGAQDRVITARTRRYRRRVKHALEAQLINASQNNTTTGLGARDQANLLFGQVLGFNIAARGGASAAELNAMLNAVQAQLDQWQRNC